MGEPNEILKAVWWAGVRAVRGYEAVSAALDTDFGLAPDRIVAVGKAAASMAKAATDRFGADVPCLVITKYGHSEGAELPATAEVMESSHPVPDAACLSAGARLLEVVSGMAADSHLLLLVSGGASSLVEVLEDGLTLGDLAAVNAGLLADGLDIHAMNARRKTLSRIKGGKLLQAFPGARVTVFAISDVEGDDIGVIGSGIGAAPDAPGFAYSGRIVASNAIARAAAAAEADALRRRGGGGRADCGGAGRAAWHAHLGRRTGDGPAAEPGTGRAQSGAGPVGGPADRGA